MSLSPVAIIGAGPYGISLAAHLKSAGIDFRIFGKPMYRWRCQMPKAMFLKSEGRASSLSDATASYVVSRGRKEGAWFSVDDLVPFLAMCVRLLLRGMARLFGKCRAGRGKSSVGGQTDEYAE